MSIFDQVQQDVITAQKAGDTAKLEALRFLRNSLLVRAKDLRQASLTDEEATAVISKELKKRREAVTAFTAGNRPELAAKEQTEADLLQQYLPPQLSDEAITELIKVAAAEAGLTPPYDFGRLMGVVIKKVAGQADGTKVKELVQAFVNKST